MKGNMSEQITKEYLLLFRSTAWYNELTPEQVEQAMAKFKVWYDELNEGGKLKAAQPLARQGAIVSGKSGKVLSDGPFAESKEAIGGYFLVQVENLEEAIAIAKASPAIEYGAEVEVRPIAAECPLMSRAREIAEEALVEA
jgi:hypothetical protein